MSVLFIIFSKARIWPKRSSSRYFGSFIEILTFHWAEMGGGGASSARHYEFKKSVRIFSNAHRQ